MRDSDELRRQPFGLGRIQQDNSGIVNALVNELSDFWLNRGLLLILNVI